MSGIMCLNINIYIYIKKKELIISIKTALPLPTPVFYCSTVPPQSHLPSVPERNKWMNNYRYKHLEAIWRVFFPSSSDILLNISASLHSLNSFFRRLHSPLHQSRRASRTLLWSFVFNPPPPSSLFTPPPSIMLPLTSAAVPLQTLCLRPHLFWSLAHISCSKQRGGYLRDRLKVLTCDETTHADTSILYYLAIKCIFVMRHVLIYDSTSIDIIIQLVFLSDLGWM